MARLAPLIGSWLHGAATSSTRPLFVGLHVALGVRQPRPQDPHELRRRRPDLRPGVRQVVLHGRVRQAEAVGGSLL